MLWNILLIVGAVYLYQHLSESYNYWKNRNIKSTNSWPLIGDMGPWLYEKLSFPELLQEMYNKFSGRYFGFHKYTQPVLMLKDPELIKQITVKQFDSFLNHKEFLSGNMKPEIEQYCLSALTGIEMLY